MWLYRFLVGELFNALASFVLRHLDVIRQIPTFPPRQPATLLRTVSRCCAVGELGARVCLAWLFPRPEDALGRKMPESNLVTCFEPQSGRH